MRAMRMFVRNIPRTHVSFSNPFVNDLAKLTSSAGIKEVVTLTSDLSRKNLEKDFERMDTPQGTFYRKSTSVPISITKKAPRGSDLLRLLGVYFDILLALDGSEFNAELVCQGEVMGRCTARFR